MGVGSTGPQAQQIVRLQYNSPSPHMIGVVTLKDGKTKAGPFTLTQGVNKVPAVFWDAVKDLPDVKHYRTAKEEDGPGGTKVPLIEELPAEADEETARLKKKEAEKARAKKEADDAEIARIEALGDRKREHDRELEQARREGPGPTDADKGTPKEPAKDAKTEGGQPPQQPVQNQPPPVPTQESKDQGGQGGGQRRNR